MSVLKYKNASGNWVEATDIYCGNGKLTFKTAEMPETVGANGVQGFDLREYQKYGDAWAVFTCGSNANMTKCIFSLGTGKMMCINPSISNYASLGYPLIDVCGAPAERERYLFESANFFSWEYSDGYLTINPLYSSVTISINGGFVIYPDFE